MIIVMKRFLRMLWVASVVGVIWLGTCLTRYEGGYACLLHQPDSEALQAVLERLEGEEIAFSAYAVTRAEQVSCLGRTFSDASVWEAYSLQRGALELVEGRLPEEPGEVMLCERAAQAFDPTLQCVGESVCLRGEDCRVTGIFRRREGVVGTVPDVIVPAGRTRAYAEVFFYTETSAFSSAQAALLRELLQVTSEAGYAETLDVDALCQSGRQRVRLFGAASVCAACLALWRQERARRGRAMLCLRQSVYATPGRALLRGLGAFLRDIRRSVWALAGAVLALGFCARRLYLPPDALPDSVFSLSAWRALIEEGVLQRLSRSTFLIPAVQHARTLHGALSLCALVGLFAALGAFSPRRD